MFSIYMLLSSKFFNFQFRRSCVKRELTVFALPKSSKLRNKKKTFGKFEVFYKICIIMPRCDSQSQNQKEISFLVHRKDPIEDREKI